MIPEIGSISIKNWFDEYIRKQVELIGNIRLIDLEKVLDKIIKSVYNGGRVFICGNGGSLSNAQHFTCDFNKGASDAFMQFQAITLGSNPSLFSACGNDLGYEEVFVRELKSYLPDDNDVFIGISVSGNSENVLRAMQFAIDSKTHTVAIVGKNGNNSIGKIADHVIGFDSCHFGLVEDVTQVFLHLLSYVFIDHNNGRKPK